MVDLIGNVVDMIAYFTEIALSDPINPIIMLVSVAFLGLSVGVFGYLALGAVVDVFTSDRGREPPQQA